jgi:hypothetical protein
MSERNDSEPNEQHDNDDLFVGPDPFISAATANDLTSSDFSDGDFSDGDFSESGDTSLTSEVLSEEEQLYANGPNYSVKKSRRGRGRPTLEESAREKTRLRVQRWRAKQISGIQKKWQENLAALSQEEKAELLKQQDLCSSLLHEMNSAIVAIANNKTNDCDLIYQLLTACTRLDGFGLVNFWCPSNESANNLTADDWEKCDDPDYQAYGLRTRLVRLFFREFLRWANRAMEANPVDVDPAVAEEIKNTLVSMDPPKEIRFVPEPVNFTPERERQRRITEKEIVEETLAHEKQLLEDWNCRQIREQMGQTGG